MIHTHNGLSPSPYYDVDDYQLPCIKSESTMNELDRCCGITFGKVVEYTIDTDKNVSSYTFGWAGNNNAGHIASRAGGMYLEFSDTIECDIVGIKISLSTIMNRRPENDMSVDELVAEYGWIE